MLFDMIETEVTCKSKMFLSFFNSKYKGTNLKLEKLNSLVDFIT